MGHFQHTINQEFPFQQRHLYFCTNVLHGRLAVPHRVDILHAAWTWATVKSCATANVRVAHLLEPQPEILFANAKLSKLTPLSNCPRSSANEEEVRLGGPCYSLAIGLILILWTAFAGNSGICEEIRQAGRQMQAAKYYTSLFLKVLCRWWRFFPTTHIANNIELLSCLRLQNEAC